MPLTVRVVVFKPAGAFSCAVHAAPDAMEKTTDNQTTEKMRPESPCDRGGRTRPALKGVGSTRFGLWLSPLIEIVVPGGYYNGKRFARAYDSALSAN